MIMKKEKEEVLPIGREEVKAATRTLFGYRLAKAKLNERLSENEKWYRLRHGESLNGGDTPVSAWLFNCIASKHADSMDSIPIASVLAREEADRAEAERLSEIIPQILEQNGFEQTFSDEQWYKLKNGTGVFGVFWDGSKSGGLGDIAVTKIDLTDLYWQPGVNDIQKSENLFHTELIDNAVLEREYPSLIGKLGTGRCGASGLEIMAESADKSLVVDWYYRVNVGGKTVLHYCKYVGENVIFATENTEAYRESGLYAHGMYPFVFDVLFPVENSPAGFGYIDVGKNAQEYIDRGDTAVMENLLSNARPRHFIRSDGAVNEKEFADLSNTFIHVDGNLGADSIMPVQSTPLNDVYLKVISGKIEELKETTGNRDVSTGGTTSGVTAAAAIAAMQEAGSKLSRDATKQSYRAFAKLVDLIIELIRQFYVFPRPFRVTDRRGTEKFIRYGNAGLLPEPQGSDFGIDTGTRLPKFRVTVSSENRDPYSRASQNELALKLYEAGFFDPENRAKAEKCLEIMDFNGREKLLGAISGSKISGEKACPDD